MAALRKISILFLLCALFIRSQVAAQWPCRSDVSLPITTNTGNQWNVRLTSDGKSGAIMVWQDRRNSSIDKLYIQRVDASGSILFQEGGIMLADAQGFQYYPQIIMDGPGGAFIVWQDNRYGVDYDIFVQRISPGGTSMWSPSGTLVCNAIGHQYYPQIVSDGQDGIIIVWQDRRSGQFDIYAQRFNGSGQALWQLNGQVICSIVGDQVEPQLVSDGSGGAIIAWTDYRGGTADIYAQRVLSSGQPSWTTDGVPVCLAPNVQWNVQIVRDGVGSGIICWQDRRAGTYDNIYAQRLDAIGQPKWAADGVPLAAIVGLQYYPKMASDGVGGAVVVWQDNRAGSDYNIYGQRINTAGQLLWLDTGQPICTALGNQYNPRLVVDGQSVLAVWQDRRNGTDYDVGVQRLSLNGVPQWSINGVDLTNSPYDQFNPQLSVDSAQGAIVAWVDYRGASGFTDIYAQRIGANGKPAGGCYRTFTQDSLALRGNRLWVGRKIVGIPNAGNVRDSVFKRGIFPFPKGLIVGIERTDGHWEYGWESFPYPVFARFALPQTGIPQPFYFRGKRVSGIKRLYNNKLAGNLLALKLNIAASDVGIIERQLGDLIFKDPSDKNNILNNKSLRQVTATIDSALTIWQVMPARYPGLRYTLLDSCIQNINNAFDGPIDTISTRPLCIKAKGPLYSVPFLLPNYQAPAEIPPLQEQNFGSEFPDEFILSQNYPNPFNPLTTIEFNLFEPSITTLKVYNILGQEVAVLFDHATLEDGNQFVDFDASALSSGVYFYRLIAEPLNGGHTLISKVQKMILVK